VNVRFEKFEEFSFRPAYYVFEKLLYRFAPFYIYLFGIIFLVSGLGERMDEVFIFLCASFASGWYTFFALCHTVVLRVRTLYILSDTVT